MGDFAKVLEGITKLDGVEGAFLIDSSGKIAESSSKKDIDLNQVSVLTLKTLEGAKVFGSMLEKKGSGQNYLEYQNLNFTFDLFPKDFYLIVVGRAGANLGRIRYEIKRSKKLMEGLEV